MKNILLTEAEYKDKYPPLGLMKISTYHKLCGDNVVYSRELLKKERKYFQEIYISTRFSFHWKRTKELIEFYQKNYDAKIIIGGIHASINPHVYEKTFGIRPVIGPLKGDIHNIINSIQNDEDLHLIKNEIVRYGIDVLPPDYSIFNNQILPFSEILENYYLLRATKGCKRSCPFCDVKKICPEFINELPIIPIVKYIDRKYGKKPNILFFDDNTLFSKNLKNIIEDLVSLGFEIGSKFNNKNRFCDFNQGLDLRLIKEEEISLLKRVCINPIRFAFDNISIKSIFIKKIQDIIKEGFKEIAVYILYNYDDLPEDFYERLRIIADLNEKYGCRIYSFPMKYVPNNQLTRQFIGRNWNKRMIRGIQCILNSSHGIVPVKSTFFRKAFGNDTNEFLKIINMPEKYIINRYSNIQINERIKEWEKIYDSLNDKEFNSFQELISNGKGKINTKTNSSKIIKILKHYDHEA